MPAVEALCHLFGINPSKLTKHQNLLLEAELFTRLCDKLQENFKEQYKGYFQLIKFDLEKENAMIDANLIRLIIKDILSTEEYTLQGIAYYTCLPEEVIQQILIDNNINPSVTILRKMMELHRSVRKDLYNELVQKIHLEYLAA